MFGVYQLGRITPTGFLPEEDQGAFFVVIQLPDGASVGRTTSVVQQVESILKQEHAIDDFSSIIGLNFIDNYSQPNAAFVIVSLKPFEERKDASQSAPALIASLGQKMRAGVRGGFAVPIAPPPIIGLGTGGGFSFVLQDFAGGNPRALAQALRGLLVAANQDSKLARVFSTFSATNPSIYLDIDRDKAQVLGVDISNIFQALQASLGGYYKKISSTRLNCLLSAFALSMRQRETSIIRSMIQRYWRQHVLAMGLVSATFFISVVWISVKMCRS
jgi:multidrug efflux pump subunit AcrB